eukprot:s2614_g2.t1
MAIDAADGNGNLSGAEKRAQKRRKIMAQLELCGLDKEANRLMVEASSSALTASNCQRLCQQLVRNVEVQQELAKLEDEEEAKKKDFEERLGKLEDLEVKWAAKQLLLQVRQRLEPLEPLQVQRDAALTQ